MKKFVMYMPGSVINEFHRKSPWIMFPKSFKELGYDTTLMCKEYLLSDTFDIKIETSFSTDYKWLSRISEQFYSFLRILKLKPDIVMVAPVTSYLPITNFLIVMVKALASIHFMKRIRFVLKMDWNFDYTGLSQRQSKLLNLLLFQSFYAFDKLFIETYCGIRKARGFKYFKMEKLSRLPLGYPQGIMEIKAYSSTLREDVILCVARIAKMKGQFTLLNAFMQLKHKYPSWKLYFVGPIEDREYFEQLSNLITSEHLKERVKFFNFVNEKDLVNFFSTSSIFCLPSIYKETAGQVKYEALSQGLVVITSDIPCRQDFEEIGCLVFEAGNVDILRNLLESVMRDGELRSKISKKAQENLVSYRDLANQIIIQLQ